MSKTRVLFVTRSYWPDVHTGDQTLTALCEGLAEEFEVEVISGRSNDRPNHRRSIVGLVRKNGVTIHRLLHTFFSDSSLVGDLINRITFSVAAVLAVLWRSPRPDIVIVQSDTPFLPVLGRFIKWRYRIPYVAHVSDRSFIATITLTHPSSNRIIRLGRAFSAKSFNQASRVVVDSKCTHTACRDSGIRQSLIEMISNAANVNTPRNGSHPLTLSSMKHRLATASSLKASRQALTVGIISRPNSLKEAEVSRDRKQDPTVVSMLAELIASHDNSNRQQSAVEQWSKLLRQLALPEPTEKADPR